jgi:hypothetical protein
VRGNVKGGKVAHLGYRDDESNINLYTFLRDKVLLTNATTLNHNNLIRYIRGKRDGFFSRC